jgi:outer membrane immunogenic protein
MPGEQEGYMKRILIAGALALCAAGQALAADLPQAMPPPRAPAVYVPPPVYNWGGVYLGLNGGYGFGNSTWTDPNNPSGEGSTGSFGTGGGLIGGTVGFNYQVNQFVLGAEADIDWSDINGSVEPNFCNLFVSATALATRCETKNNWLGTVRARAGFAVDRVLFYGTAGLAFGDVEAGLKGGSVGSVTYQSNTQIGWTAGAGVEWAFTDNWTARVEYLYVDLGNSTCNAATSCGFDGLGATSPASDTVKFTANLVRAGVDYKFGP